MIKRHRINNRNALVSPAYSQKSTYADRLFSQIDHFLKMVFSIPVLEDHGLEICWKNDAPAGNFTKCLSSEGSNVTVSGNEYCFDCEKYDIPTWLDGFVTFLWVLFAIGTVLRR